MKKIKLLVAPLLVLPFIASCGGGNTSSHSVSEQEFNDACSFKNVQYVQSNMISKDNDKIYTYLAELSPTVSHTINESTSQLYNEVFTRKKEDGAYEKATREDKSKEQYVFGDATESEFITPQTSEFNVLEQLKHAKLNYKSFTYNDKEGTYSVTFPEESGTQAVTTLKFENKMLVSEAFEGSDGGSWNTTFTYETKTPEYPKK